jgi:hypothetical protein
MAARFTRVDAVDVQPRIEHRGAPFEQAVAQLGDPECVIDVRPAPRAPRPSNAEVRQHDFSP